MRCLPANHKYIPHGRILYCEKCGDPQPLWVEEESVSPTQNSDDSSNSFATPSPEIEPTTGEIEAQIKHLRDISESIKNENLGKNMGQYYGDIEGDVGQFDPGPPRIRVDEGFKTNAYNDSIPDAGL